MSIHRFYAVYDPIKYAPSATECPTLGICLCCFTGFLLGLLPILGWRYDKNWDDASCFFMDVIDYKYVLLLSIVGFILPILTLLLTYGMICAIIIRSSRNSIIRNNNNDERMRNQQRRVTKTVCIVVGIFVLFWLPIGTINTYNSFCEDCFKIGDVINFSLVISHSNAAINPLIYAYRIPEIRNALKSLIKREWLRTKIAKLWLRK